MQGVILLSGEPGKEELDALIKITGREESSFYLQRVDTDTAAFVRKGLFFPPDDIRLPANLYRKGSGEGDPTIWLQLFTLLKDVQRDVPSSFQLTSSAPFPALLWSYSCLQGEQRWAMERMVTFGDYQSCQELNGSCLCRVKRSTSQYETEYKSM